MALMVRQKFQKKSISEQAEELADEVELAVFKHGTKNHPEFGEILAYEVDGFGNQRLWMMLTCQAFASLS